jgi:hypothetical protein
MFLFLYVWIHAHKRIYKRNFKVVWLLENTIFVLMLLPTHFSIFVPVLTNQTYWSKSIKFALLLLKSHFGITYQTIFFDHTISKLCNIFITFQVILSFYSIILSLSSNLVLSYWSSAATHGVSCTKGNGGALDVNYLTLVYYYYHKFSTDWWYNAESCKIYLLWSSSGSKNILKFLIGCSKITFDWVHSEIWLHWGNPNKGTHLLSTM